MASDYKKFVASDTVSWRQEASTVQKEFDIDLEDDASEAIFEEAFLEKEEKVQVLLDIARHYLHPIEAEILFLFLRNRRNKDISMILKCAEPEVARYKRIIVKKCGIFYMFKYLIDIKQFLPYVVEVAELNEKQAAILKLFFEFRSLSYIGEKQNSKSSNMHRSLNAIKLKCEQLQPMFPELSVVLAFYKYSRYINTSNPNFSLVQELI